MKGTSYGESRGADPEARRTVTQTKAREAVWSKHVGVRTPEFVSEERAG